MRNGAEALGAFSRAVKHHRRRHYLRLDDVCEKLPAPGQADQKAEAERDADGG